MKTGTWLATLELPNGPVFTLHFHPTRKGAAALWCGECSKVIADSCDALWDMSKTRLMHAHGMKHKPVYVTLTPAAVAAAAP